jgi:hypothetical protein
MIIPESDIPQSLRFIPLGYRAMHRVLVSDPRALILPHAEAGGRLLTTLEFRKADERSRIERHRPQAQGLRRSRECLISPRAQ